MMKNTHLHKTLRSKKGLALESAVVFMLIILALCTLLITLAIMGRYQLKSAQAEMFRDIEREQICEDFLAYVSAVTVTQTDANGVSPSPSTPPPEGTGSFYDYIHNGGNAAIIQRDNKYKERYSIAFYSKGSVEGKYSCFDVRTPATGGTVKFELYALDAKTNELILYAVATKTPETVNDNGSVRQGTVTLISCLSNKPQ